MKLSLSTIMCGLWGMAFCQIGGNQLYGNHSNNYSNSNVQINQSNLPKLSMTEHELVLDLNILNHVQADFYMVTLGVNEENLSVEKCNSQINIRINQFLDSLSKIGIKKSDVYVDFISQTKIYDYVSESEGENINVQQVDVGFEIKKNIVFKLSKIELFDKIIELASQQNIHNIINVEYYAEDQNKVYDQMLEEALKLKTQRLKFLNLKDSDWNLEPIYTISFYSIQPGHQYKKFQAYESGTVSYSNYYNNNSVIVRKEERKSNTFYFDGLDSNNFDKIMNASSPVIGLQYIMNVKVTYKKKEKEKSNQIYHVITPTGELKTLELN